MCKNDISGLTVAQVKARLDALSDPEESLLRLLESDPRAGVRTLAGRARARKKAEEGERARIEHMLALEKGLRARGFTHIAGVDEAGRGPLAGPVVAAAVILPPDAFIAGLNDSKALSEQRRESLFDAIQQTALAFSIAQADPEEIDRINIRNATHLAMRRALEGLSIAPGRVLVDGNALPESPFPEQAVVGGDRQSLCIAAASVLAKVTRDRLMVALDAQYPAYGFARHKGYGSPDHLDALRQHGPCPIHRRTFGGVSEVACRRSEDFDVFAEGIEKAQTPEQLTAIGESIASARGLLPEGEIAGLRTLYLQRRQALSRSGPAGERIAADHLKARGFTILETNYRAIGGEIDLIAQKGDVLAFVEVKTASTDRFGSPESWVTPQKQAQIIRIAGAYLHRHPAPSANPRFDVVAIFRADGQMTVRHIEGAFMAPG